MATNGCTWSTSCVRSSGNDYLHVRRVSSRVRNLIKKISGLEVGVRTSSPSFLSYSARQQAARTRFADGAESRRHTSAFYPSIVYSEVVLQPNNILAALRVEWSFCYSLLMRIHYVHQWWEQIIYVGCCHFKGSSRRYIQGRKRVRLIVPATTIIRPAITFRTHQFNPKHTINYYHPYSNSPPFISTPLFLLFNLKQILKLENKCSKQFLATFCQTLTNLFLQLKLHGFVFK